MRKALILLQCIRRHDKPIISQGRGASANAAELLHKGIERLESLDRAADFNTYSVLLRQCSSIKALAEGKKIHAHISKHGFVDLFLHNTLIQMYGSCGSLIDARNVFDSIVGKNSFSWNIMLAAYAQNGSLHQAKFIFDQMPEKSVISWTALITAYSQNGNGRAAVSLFCLMDLEGVTADKITFVSVIDACSSLRSLQLGKILHLEVFQSGDELHYAVATALISMYGKCRRVENSKEMFDKMQERNMVTWTAMITVYAQNGYLGSALALYELMPERNVVSSTALMAAYALNGHLRKAEDLFEKMAVRNAITWSTMILAYGQNGHTSKALEVFNAMEREGLRADKCTFVSALDVCTTPSELLHGRRIHRKVIKVGLESNLIVGNALINMYSKCGQPLEAKSVFDRMPEKIFVSYNLMLAGFAQNGFGRQAKELLEKMPERDIASWNTVLVADAQRGDFDEARRVFASMPEHDVVSRNAMILVRECEEEAVQAFRELDLDGFQPNRITYTSVLEACGNIPDLEFARLLLDCIADTPYKSDVYVGTTLVNTFAKCESFEESRAAFDAIPAKNVLSWTAMLSAYAQFGHIDEARKMFDLLPLRDMAAWNAMISGYAQLGHHLEARDLFDSMPERNVISWTAMITAYTQDRHPKEAYELFRAMDLEGQKPNKFTFLKALEACAGGVTEAEARTIHEKVIESGYSTSDVAVGQALVNFYDKCGNVAMAERAFDELPDKTPVGWSIMIAAYSQAGQPKRSLELFKEMQLNGVLPTEITFVNLLNACSHGGFLYDSRQFFLSLVGDYGLTPAMDHYVCLVDLLGRSGQLKLAQDLLEHMPFEPNGVAWTALLSGCQTQGDAKRGDSIAEQIIDLKPNHSGPYRLVWNMYAASSDGNRAVETC